MLSTQIVLLIIAAAPVYIETVVQSGYEQCRWGLSSLRTGEVHGIYSADFRKGCTSTTVSTLVDSAGNAAETYALVPPFSHYLFTSPKEHRKHECLYHSAIGLDLELVYSAHAFSWVPTTLCHKQQTLLPLAAIIRSNIKVSVNSATHL
jgi:hypothetical protein